MNIQEISKEVSERLELPEYKVRPIIVTTFKVMTENIVKGAAVKISGLGTFKIDVLPPKTVVVNFMKKRIQLPARFKLFFKISAKLKAKIDAKKAYNG